MGPNLRRKELMSDFNKYQKEASALAIYPHTNVVHPYKGNISADYIYPVMGLCGEVGELANKVKKFLRDNLGQIKGDDGEVLPEFKEIVMGELSGTLWYVNEVATSFNIKLGDVAEYNIKQLNDRKERGVLNGSGDNR